MSVTFNQHEREQIFAIADVLVPATDSMPSFRDADPDFVWGDRAIAAHPSLREGLVRLLAESASAGALDDYLRRLFDERPDEFELVATFVIGAYVMIPDVKQRYRYPGQQQLPAPADQAAEELSDEVFEGAMSYKGTYREVDP